mmetsp:Transcript_21722/g.32970  ORF Transcript_21722/g.32970 Transcript_21722/m.32970 type:complete len:302 (+) Transcript_21722:167-1072(+)
MTERQRNKQVAALQHQCDQFKNELHNRDKNLQMLEIEREELQGCLDKTMKELARADHELRQSSNVKQPLQHLYTWITERYNSPDQAKEEVSADTNTVVQQIKNVIESTVEKNNKQRVRLREEQEHLSARDKRDFARQKLQQMLSNASSRYEQIGNTSENPRQNNEDVGQNQNAEVEQLKRKLQDYSDQLTQKEEEIERLEKEFSVRVNFGPNDEATKLQIERLQQEVLQNRATDNELTSVKKELEEKTKAERMLNESLAEALGLLKPLQYHLDAAEREKKALAKELKRANKKIKKLVESCQ